jgi:hypothetical protein
LTDACQTLYRERGDAASVDGLREQLNDPGLDAFVVELCASAPSGEGFDQGIKDVKAGLAGSRQKSLRESITRQLSPDANEHDHLDLLRQWRDRSAP